IVFFFQAEDGIRDRNVTGVQTYALPILKSEGPFKAQADIKMLNPLQIEIKNRYLQFHIRHHTSLIEQIKKQQILMIYRLFQMTSIWIISFSLMFLKS